jgi:hypothetical protein
MTLTRAPTRYGESENETSFFFFFRSALDSDSGARRVRARADESGRDETPLSRKVRLETNTGSF